jgi:hypothetical protein
MIICVLMHAHFVHEYVYSELAFVCMCVCMYVCMNVCMYATSSAVADRRETWRACRSLTVAAKGIAVIYFFLFLALRHQAFLFLRLAAYIYNIYLFIYR